MINVAIVRVQNQLAVLRMVEKLRVAVSMLFVRAAPHHLCSTGSSGVKTRTMVLVPQEAFSLRFLQDVHPALGVHLRM